MSASDLWRLEQPIVAHYSGAGINAELMSTAIRGQWRGKLRAKGYELLGCLDGGPIPPMSAWSSKNWPWLFTVALLLWARENQRVDVEARVWEWVEATLEEQLRGGRWMDSEAFSRIYLMHQLSPVVCLYRESGRGDALPERVATLLNDLHAWIVTAATALALTTYQGKSAMIGARSVSDPPAHLAHWLGDKILAALREGTNPYEDDGSLSSKAHRAMWRGYVLRGPFGPMGNGHPEDVIEELPGVLGVWELYRYESGVLWVCRDTTGLAVGSTDPGLAGWSGESGTSRYGDGWASIGVAFWWANEDGNRNGGKNWQTEVAAAPGRRTVEAHHAGHVYHFTVYPKSKLLYVLRWDSSGCRRIDGEPLRNEEGSAGDTNQPDLTARNKWPSLVNGTSFGQPIADPDDEAVRLVLWRILKTGGASSDILDDLRAHLGTSSSSSADREIADAARRLWEVMA